MAKYNLSNILERSYPSGTHEWFWEVVSSLPKCTPDGPWLAGGALRSALIGQKPDSDWDFFFRDADQFEAFVASIKTMPGATRVAKTEHHITFTAKVDGKAITVQAIRIDYYANIEALLDSFDFTICQFGYDGTDLHCGEFSLWDLARKKLAIHRLTYGVSTVRRLIKYTRKGFTACGGVLADILQRTVADPQTINSNIEYVD